MKNEIFEVISNTKLTDSVFEMVLKGDISEIEGRPGTFVNIKLDGLYLRRPISVCNVENGKLTLVYKVVGKGTELMAKMTGGEKLDLLVGLGNGYNMKMAGTSPLLLGGGVGVPPLYYLCKLLRAQGITPTVILGFNTKAEVFYEEQFISLGANVTVATADGSYGVKGFVTSCMPKDYSYFYTCGPEPMLKAVYNSTNTSGELSFEERMGCGFGACMGCSCKTITGNKRICKEGPVMKKEDIIWEK